MCKYCEKNKIIRSVNWKGQGEINIEVDGYLTGKDDEKFSIKFCPMCGRKLGGSNE